MGFSLTANNAAIDRGEQGEFGRQIIVRELRSEVALHYLFNFHKSRFVEAVDLGVEAARAWCKTNDVA